MESLMEVLKSLITKSAMIKELEVILLFSHKEL